MSETPQPRDYCSRSRASGLTSGFAACCRSHGLPLLLSCLLACRIYREEAAPAPASANAERVSGQAVPPPTAAREERAGSAASEALNLWVLNRREGDLQALGADAPPAPPRPRRLVLIALGLGPPQSCSEQLARGALDALVGGVEPARVTAHVIEALRRSRWPEVSSAAFSSVLRSSRGHFGGLEAAPATTLSASALLTALGRRALLDGRSTRWLDAALAGAGGPLEGLDCSALDAGQLSGAAGILLRTEAGEFWGGMLSRDEPADAGVLSTVAQYGVSVAVGAAGGVLLVAGCATPPPESLAEHVYASDDWNAASRKRGGDECSGTHLLLTRERAWVSRPIPLAWSAVEEPVQELPSAPPAPAVPPDAGAHQPNAPLVP